MSHIIYTHKCTVVHKTFFDTNYYYTATKFNAFNARQNKLTTSAIFLFLIVVVYSSMTVYYDY